MTSVTQLRRFHVLKTFTQIVGLIVILVGVVVLIGWGFNITILKNGWPGWPTMKPNTALGFCLAGASLGLLSLGRIRINTLPAAQGLGLVVALLGLVTLGQDWLGWDLGIDRWLFRAAVEQDSAPPGRMSPVTAFGFVLIGSSLCLFAWRSRVVELITQLLPLIVGTVSVLVLAGYVFDVRALTNFGFATTMAVHTAAALLLLSIALLCARPELEPMLTFTGDLSGGQVARSLLPAIFVLIFAMGWLEALGERAGLYRAGYFIILLSVSAAILLAFLIWASTARLEKTDRQRRQAEAAMRASEERYRRTLDQMLEGGQIIGFDWRYLYINDAGAKHGHQTRENLFGYTLQEVYPGIEQTALFATLEQCMSQRVTAYLESEFIYPDGARSWFELSIQPVTEGLFILSIDITERKHAEDKLRNITIELEALVTKRTTSLRQALTTTQALYDISHSVNRLESLAAILRAIVDTIVVTLPADRVVLITVDQQAQRIVHFVSGGPGAAHVNLSVSYSELQEGLSGWVMHEHRSALSLKGQPDPRESRAATHCGSMVVVPLQSADEVLGTITVINTPEQRDFNEQDVVLFETIANRATSAILKVQLVEQLRETNKLLEQQGSALQRELVERQRAEAETNRIYELSIDIICIVGTDGYFKRINPALSQILGYSREELLTVSFFSFIHPDDILASQLEIQKLAEGIPTTNFANRFMTKSGVDCWIAWAAQPTSDGLVIAVGRNITEQRQAAEALRLSEERLHLMTWATKDAVWDWDLKTNQRWWGEGLQKILHYPASPAYAEPTWWSNVIHRDDRAKVEQTIQTALEGRQEFWAIEYRCRKADNTYANVLDRGYILYDADQRAYRMIGAVVDITERKRIEEALQRQNEFLSALHQITLDVLNRREIDELLQALVVHATQLLDAIYGEIMLLDNEALVVRATTANLLRLVGEKVSRAESKLSWQAFDTQHPAVLSDYATWPNRRDVYSTFRLRAVADFPIIRVGVSIGVLAIGRDKLGYPFDADHIQSGILLAQLAALVLDNAQLREGLRQESIRDAVTGLFNRRYLEETLEREVQRAARETKPLIVIMLDVDHLKRVNDAFGHAAGDQLLSEIGGLLRLNVRGEDVACRYGGDEFVLMLPGASTQIAQQRAEQLRESAAQLPIEFQGQPIGQVTLSLGIAAYPDHGATSNSVLRAADAALYRAKQLGRDRVVVAAKL